MTDIENCIAHTKVQYYTILLITQLNNTSGAFIEYVPIMVV